MAKPLTLDHNRFNPSRFPLERAYLSYMRCVESAVDGGAVDWFSTLQLLALAEPTSNAKYVAFETIYAPEQMPGGQQDRFIGGGLKYHMSKSCVSTSNASAH